MTPAERSGSGAAPPAPCRHHEALMSPPSTSTSRLTGLGARRRRAEGGGAKSGGGEGWSQAEGGWSQAERSRPPAKTVKCFQTRTVEQRRFGWCLISGGWGRGLWRGRPFVFPASEAPHGRQLPVWEEDEEEKKKVDGDFRPYFQNWVHPRRGKANCVGGE